MHSWLPQLVQFPHFHLQLLGVVSQKSHLNHLNNQVWSVWGVPVMEGEPLLDLCHLTEVEQTVIFSVLQRDAELRNKEEGRIRSVCVQYWTYLAKISYMSNARWNVCVFRKLQQTVSDPVHLRSLTGVWFHEERAKRYQKGGTDVVHASIHRKRHEKGHMISHLLL